MFCYQCEQTAKGTGCTNQGVCGKDPDCAALQDLLLAFCKGIAWYAHRARQQGSRDREIDVFIQEALFSTITNVNFDAQRLHDLLKRADALKQKAQTLYQDACKRNAQQPAAPTGLAELVLAEDHKSRVEQAALVGIEELKKRRGEALAGLEYLCLYGLKGMAAYVDHAQILGVSDPEVDGFFHQALHVLSEDRSSEELLSLALQIGAANVVAMELLDRANTAAYGQPVPTRVRIEPVAGKAILVSGHDLKDLEELLKQTQGKNIQVYTHGEMLPAHGYPGLHQFGHLAGNYGSSWQEQRKDFAAFPGAILMTTNCIQRPQESYQARIFTSGLVAWPGVVHIKGRDFGPLIEAALAAPGFESSGPDKTILVGFGHNAVLAVADQVIEAVKRGAIKHFFLIGGCDGAKSGRNYYTDLAKAVPKDSVILTLACGKYRFNKQEFGDIGGIPRLLDMGQCNDAYSAIVVAGALAKAFNKDVNDLPLSLVLSWYEQKAVAILLSLLYMGIHNIRLGPSLPAFISPSTFKILQEKFNLMPISTAEKDLQAIVGS